MFGRRMLAVGVLLLGAAVGVALGIRAAGSPAQRLVWDRDAFIVRIVQRTVVGRDCAWLEGAAEPGYAREWWRCRASRACSRLPGRAETITTPALRRGDWIEFRAVGESRTLRVRTPSWTGPVRSTRAPSFTGALTVGSVLEPHRGTWRGGFGVTRGDYGLQACPTRALRDCRLMSGREFGNGDKRRATLGPGYAGWYIGAFDVNIGGPHIVPAVAYVIPRRAPGDRKAPRPDATVAFGPLVGPVRWP